MGLDPVSMFVISAATQVASGLMQYSQQKKADKQAKQAANAEADIMEADAARAAQAEIADAEKTRRLQRMTYLKSGVDLEGSPLLVMEETRTKGAENAANVTASAKAKADLIRRQGSIKRASLINTGLDIAKGVTGSYNDYSVLKKQLSPASSSSTYTKSHGWIDWN